MQNASLHRSFRHLAALAGLGLAAVVASAGIKSERHLAAIITHTPAPRIVAEGAQMKAADEAAAELTGAQTFWGIGQSMQPLYAPNTAIVVQPIAYKEIKKGMTLVYTKRNGHVVAHSVVGEDAHGYVVQGVNNDQADRESVNERNLIGVVVAAYATNDSAERVELARSLVSKGRLTKAAAQI
jgi:signal peptidase I